MNLSLFSLEKQTDMYVCVYVCLFIHSFIHSFILGEIFLPDEKEEPFEEKHPLLLALIRLWEDGPSRAVMVIFDYKNIRRGELCWGSRIERQKPDPW